ncbi:MAG: hypothetical protein JW776_01085 [Candidatus Lokiarchaeota archaeon]|nr:hypothetical protein [Candidatus Lokiarchaeota archaeon]
MDNSNRVYLGTTDEDFDKAGMQRIPEKWEDGQRTPLDRKHFEWWYFDAELDDGSVIVIIFGPKPFFDTHFRIFPIIAVEYRYPNGKRIRDFYFERKAKENYASSSDRCNIVINQNYFRGDLNEYEIYVNTKSIKARLKLVNKSISWRPGTGHLYFQKNNAEKYFAWFPSVPYGSVSGEITVNGVPKQVIGRGYHDHNWGNEDPCSLFNHWYWSRSHIGDYILLACDLVPRIEYNTNHAPFIVLFDKNRVIADDYTKVSIRRSEPIIHSKTKKFINNTLVFSYNDEEIKFQLKLERKRDIVLQSLQLMPSLHLFFKQVGKRPYYHRFLGDSTLNLEIDNRIREFKSSVLYELMYYGKNRHVGSLSSIN